MMHDERLGWVHYTCVNWMPEVWFTDDNKLSVQGNLSKAKEKLFCYICRQKGAGSCIQCDYKSCEKSFHVRCAIDRGLIKDWELMNDQREDEESYECFIFCESHYEIGCKALKDGGKARLKPDTAESIMKSKLE